MRNSLKVLLLAVVAGIGLSASAQAAGSGRSAKGMRNLNHNTAVVVISTGPTVLYGVIMSTAGTIGDYTVIWDSASVLGLAIGGPYTKMMMKLTASTTAQSMLPSGNPVSFDPPLQFNSGIAAVNNAATNTSTFIYEAGRVAN